MKAGLSANKAPGPTPLTDQVVEPSREAKACVQQTYNWTLPLMSQWLRPHSVLVRGGTWPP